MEMIIILNMVQTKEFKLSDWVFCIECKNYFRVCVCEIPNYFISINKSQKFIKLLKEDLFEEATERNVNLYDSSLDRLSLGSINDAINELAGENLNGN